jgi:hypothetical protein
MMKSLNAFNHYANVSNDCKLLSEELKAFVRLVKAAKEHIKSHPEIVEGHELYNAAAYFIE